MSNETPYSEDCERSVLGCCMLDASAASIALGSLTPEHFYLPNHAAIFTAMIGLAERKEPIDEVSVNESLKRGGSFDGSGEFLCDLVYRTPTAANLEYYMAQVKDLHLRRLAMMSMDDASDRASDDKLTAPEVIGDAIQRMSGLAEKLDDSDFVSGWRIGTDEIVAMAGRKLAGVSGLSFGLTDLDKKAGGLKPGELLILAARPSMGKTALALQIALHVAVRQRKCVLVFSLEMSDGQIAQRAIANLAGVDIGRITNGTLDDNENDAVVGAVDAMKQSKFFVCDRGALSIAEIAMKSKKQALASGGIDLVVVDYLQLATASGADNREREIAKISMGLKALAKDLGIPVLALSQLNRGVEARSGEGKRPVMSDLRDSGSLEQDADIVMLMYRDEYYNKDTEARGLVEVSIAKNRNGPTGLVTLRWDPVRMRFAQSAFGRGE